MSACLLAYLHLPHTTVSPVYLGSPVTGLVANWTRVSMGRPMGEMVK